MVFSSSVFIFLFLPIVFVINSLLRNRTKLSNVFLLIASLFFYAWGEPFLVLLMIFSIVFNWGCGRWISSASGRIRKIALAVSVIGDLSLLGYFKYAGFFVSILNGICRRELIPVPQITLPIGISFFTFQAMSYCIDVYREDTEASRSLINVALYISFFPQLIAGPIVKYREIDKQIAERQLELNKVALGSRRFIYGLGKKVLISNVLGLCVDTIYSFDITSIDGVAAWIGALAYTFQIYYDFSGYSDMAIGLGGMFGFEIPENFNYPYLSGSISEFWRRWHISLGSWFREYLYIPLGGNRKGKTRTNVNLFIVFLLTGLWHGADFSFIIWGGWHGVLSILERFGLKKPLDKHPIIARIYCFLAVTFGWVLFRADNTLFGLRFISRMLMPWRHSGLTIATWKYMDLKTLVIGAAAVIGAGIIKKIVPSHIQDKWKGSIPEALWLMFIFVMSVAAIASDTYNPFIYFQF